MEEAGQKLRRLRERLRLTYRDVETATQKIAHVHGNYEYCVGLSRLADIENKGTLPSLFRLYSLCAVYRIDFQEVLRWYGIDLKALSIDASQSSLSVTFPFDLPPSEHTSVDLPSLEGNLDLRRTSYLSRHLQRWGKLPLTLLNALDLGSHRYAFVGTDDWSMYPIIAPGSFLEIDTNRRKVAKDGWTGDHDRPIYFLDHRDGYKCGWCTHRSGKLYVQPHSSCVDPPNVFKSPGEAEVIGQVVGIAMRMDLAKRRHIRS